MLKSGVLAFKVLTGKELKAKRHTILGMRSRWSGLSGGQRVL